MQRTRKPRRVLASLAGAAGLAAAIAPESALAGGISVEPHSPNADDISTIYWVMLAVAVAIVVVVNLALLATAARYRAARGREASRFRRGTGRLELGVGAALGAGAVAIFLAGVVFTERARDVDPSGPSGLQASSQTTAQLDLALPGGDSEPLEIDTSGQQWIWRYEYPDGTFSYYELVVPVDTTVVLNLDSTDVVHRWWVPELGGKFDAVPGRSNQTWFRADEEGTYDGASAAFSGTAYAAMRTRVRVVGVPEYQSWLEQQAADIAAAQDAAQAEVAAGGGEVAAGGGA